MGEQSSQHPLPPQENTEPAEVEEVEELPPPRGQPPRTTRNSRSVWEPHFVIPDSVEIERPHRHHRSKAQTSPPPQEAPTEILAKHPEPRQNGRPSFKLRSPRKGTPSDRQPVTTEAPGLKAVPPRNHRQHHDNIPQTQRPWSNLNPDAEPWQPWSPINNPLETGAGPPPYSGPLEQQKPCLRPYRHLKHFRTLQPHEPRSPRRMHFPEDAEAHYRHFSPTDPSDHVQDWYHHFP